MNLYIVSSSLIIFYFFLDYTFCHEAASDLCLSLGQQTQQFRGRNIPNLASLLFSSNSKLNNHLTGYRRISREFCKLGK